MALSVAVQAAGQSVLLALYPRRRIPCRGEIYRALGSTRWTNVGTRVDVYTATSQ